MLFISYQYVLQDQFAMKAFLKHTKYLVFN